MQAAVVVDEAGSKRLELREAPLPVIAEGELLVRVRAAGLNRADLAMNVGHFRNAGATLAAAIPGVEFAGEVVEMGPAVRGFAPGDRVMAMGQGAFAEFARIDHRLAMRAPHTVDWAHAATAPVALMTAHDALITRAGLQRGESVLIQAASSGVGIIATQIARLRGARPVMGTSSSATKLAALTSAGLSPDIGIDTSKQDTVEAVMAATADRGADVIIDMVAGKTLGIHLRAAAIRGRIVCVGRMGGARAELDFDLLALRRLSLIGVTFRTRTIDEIADIVAAASAEVLPEVVAGRLHWPIDKEFSLAQVAQAYQWMRSNSHLGKLVLTP
ncbi:MAG: zinc-binding dehydrogenase [Betaproteobacteria bacterium]